jgi:two-component system, OmpR family, sensor histidine kinase VicK
MMQDGHALLLDSYKKALQNFRMKEGCEDNKIRCFRWLVRIEPEDFNDELSKTTLLATVKAFLDLGIDLRHIERLPVIQFGVRDSEQLFAIFIAEPERDGENVSKNSVKVLFSTENAFIKPFEEIFGSAWNESIDARDRIRQIEEGKTNYETKIIRDSYEILSKTKQMALSSKRYSVSSVSGGLLYAYNYAFDDFKSILEKQSKGQHDGIRWITTIDQSCIGAAKKFLGLGMKIRHIETALNESFGVSEKEVGVTLSRLEGGTLNNSALFSNDPIYVDHYTNVFEELWKNGVDAKERIKEITEGIESPTIKIIGDTAQIRENYLQLVSSAKESILLLLSTPSALKREERIGVIWELAKAAKERNVEVLILSPRNSEVERALEDLLMSDQNITATGSDSLLPESLRGAVRFREIRPPSKQMGPRATILVVDKKISFVIELRDDSKENFEETIGFGSYSNSKPTVYSYMAFFEKLWHESELREREERSRKQAELLQDILTHDIRNYSQITKLSAELLEEQLKGNEAAKPLIRSLIDSLDGSTMLLDRAKKLGRVVSEVEPKLSAVDLSQAIENSLSVVRDGFPEKKIIDERKVWINKEDYPPSVLADDLLYEVFVNLYTNSVKYTEGKHVYIETSIDEAKDPSNPTSPSYWKVTITDKGRGIPDDQKAQVFSRYLKSAKGSGLGMSIVHALVVERYKGMIRLKDRAEGDYRQGLAVEIWLRKI